MFSTMASYKSTTFGDISGRHGSAVATSGKNGNTLRVYKSPTNPRTAKQMTIRSKFSFTQSALSCMRGMLNYTLQSEGGFGKAVALVLKKGISGTEPDYTLNIGAIPIKIGSTAVATSGETVFKIAKDSTLNVSWYTGNIHENSFNPAQATDTISVAFFNESLSECMLFEDIAPRSAGEAEVELPDNWIGADAHCWFYFTRENKTLNSSAVYTGIVHL